MSTDEEETGAMSRTVIMESDGIAEKEKKKK